MYTADTTGKPIRLNAYLARCGVASRRGADRLIAQGLVAVNGQPAALGTTVEPTSDHVEVKGESLERPTGHVTIILNKPSGYLVSNNDPHHDSSKTVFALVNEIKERLVTVGRLDLDTEGVLIMTSDGSLAHGLTHPSSEVEKVYRAHVKWWPDEKALAKLRDGVMLDGRMTAKADVTTVQKSKEGSELEIRLHEGRNRQVRRICQAVGHPVIRLRRVSVGGIDAHGLPSGRWRRLTDVELTELYQAAGLLVPAS
jgi:pseudouridine synthase